MNPPPAPASAPKSEPLDLARLRRQDAHEFARLVDTHQSLVSSLCQSSSLRGPDRDDAMAEIFAAVYLALPRFQGNSQLSTWVYRIAIRTILRLKQKSRPSRSTTNETTTLPDPRPSPHDLTAATEQHQRLWHAVTQLERRQAIVVDLYYRQQWPIAQIAETMDCPENTVKTLLSRARDRLRELLEDKAEDKQTARPQ